MATGRNPRREFPQLYAMQAGNTGRSVSMWLRTKAPRLRTD